MLTEIDMKMIERVSKRKQELESKDTLFSHEQEELSNIKKRLARLAEDAIKDITSFDDLIKKNEEVKKRMAKDRAKYNQKTLHDYRITKKG
jgi:hypothetical protein